MTIYIVDLESISSRYTCEWKTTLPSLLSQNGHNIVVLNGTDDLPDNTTPGMFLNFAATNVYKSTQVEKFSRLFASGEIKSGDHFLFTDAWHPGIINLKYMSELLGIKLTIHGLWHAGSYDPADGLGRLIGNKPWVRHAEKAFYEAIDRNYFASDFHIDMFITNLFSDRDFETFKDSALLNKKIIRSGWPMEYMASHLESYQGTAKKDQIIFPHRISEEKQPDIFRDLANSMPEYEWIVCQDNPLSKAEYHQLLAESKIVFSASTQETLGIGCYEGAVLGAWPLVPNRLSYSEMYSNDFLYPSEWTENWDSYQKHKQALIDRIKHIMNHYYENGPTQIPRLVDYLTEHYFSASGILAELK